MAFEIQALQELKPNGKYKASELEDGTFVLEWDVEKNGGEAAPTRASTREALGATTWQRILSRAVQPPLCSLDLVAGR